LELDGVAIASYWQPFDDTLVGKHGWSVDDYLREQYQRWKPHLIDGDPELRPVLEVFEDKIQLDQYPGRAYWKALLELEYTERQRSFEIDREKILADFLGVDIAKVRRIDHHRCHAAYAYYSSPIRGEPVLALTVDGWGDGMNATIGVFDECGHYQRYYETDQCNIGRIYRYMTLVLGMKPNEHEYKVMGLAPYGREKYAQRAQELFDSTLYVDGLEFKWGVKPEDSYFWFKERLEGVRFDNIAYAMQAWVEKLLCRWVANAVHEYGISKVVISGGVAMNVKAMGRIAELPEVEELFIGGSGSDESMSISAGICLAEDMTREAGEHWHADGVKPMESLYLGPQASGREERSLIDRLDNELYEIVQSPEPTEVARLLSEGKVIARCVGRMEFGQRSLGNRSILADPVDLRVKDKINAMIKNRDFWMPFAPVLLDRYASQYLVNPKELHSPHMTIAFPTTEEGFVSMIAGCHPADHTTRAQILAREVNPGLYELLEAFESITGRGALLNTSFNLHGFPIVNTPAEAFEVFVHSGLDGLLLNEYLLLKR